MTVADGRDDSMSAQQALPEATDALVAGFSISGHGEGLNLSSFWHTLVGTFDFLLRREPGNSVIRKRYGQIQDLNKYGSSGFSVGEFPWF
jgi:hypothetical protein